MKAIDFTKLKGDTDIAKLTNIWPTCNFIYAQEKINGVQIRMTRGEQFTRHKIKFAPDFFPHKFRKAFSQIPDGACFLGELFIPTVPLATLAGAVNVNSTHLNQAYNDLLEIHVWDIHHWYEPAANWPFKLRHDRLRELVHSIEGFRYVCPVTCASPNYADVIYHRVCEDPASEGVVYHIPPAYHFMSDEKSSDFIKRKKRHEAEFKCVGVTEGKGKRRGLLGTFVLASEYGEFKCGGGAGLTDELLDYYYKNPPINQWITISYEEMSVNNIPLRPQFVAVRNYE